MGANLMFRRILLTLLLLPTLSLAASFGVFNFSEMRYEEEKNTNEVRSIASITKLFTAQAIVDSGVNLEEQVKVKGKSNGRFAKGIMIERYELLRAMLMSSDNLAAESLANAHPGGYEQFLKDVNDRIAEMGLRNTVIVDSTGLLPGNKSSVDDLKEFLFTLRKYTIIQTLSVEKLYTYEYQNKKRVVKINFKNTNPQLWNYDEIILTKTGFTNPAGRCIAMLVEKNGVLYALVTLGNKNVEQRSRTVAGMFSQHIQPK
jgi:D-alanyl-D-alanine endopeptidase (penicillin-binding protein 7)